MNIKSLSLVACLLILSVNVNAEIQAVSGTALMYDPTGLPIGASTPITGVYDTDTQQIIIDPWMFFGLAVNSQIQVLPPGNYLFPDVLPINVGSGQLGGMITTEWGVSTIPHGLVWDVISYTGGQHFEPVDSDGDGIPGLKMISGPFPGFTFVYEFDAGEPAPGIDVDINVAGGTIQQCAEVGGSHVELTATVELSGGAELVSIDWTVDGNATGSGTSITPFLALGIHSISVTATGVSGVYDTASTTLQVVDTVKPAMSIEFINTRTGQTVTSVDGAGVSFIEVRLTGSDVCDADIDVAGIAKPVYAITDGEVIKIQGNNKTVDMPTTAIEVTATALDDSGNKQIDLLILPINN
jgi:hypothetical protein